MQRAINVIININFFILILLIFLLFFESRVELPAWLQVAGRLHPMFLHLPIGTLIFSFILMVLPKLAGKKADRKIMMVCLLLASLSASATALFGFFLSLQGDYGTDLLQQHKMGGVALSVLIFFILLWHKYMKKSKLVFYGASLITFIVLLFAGHSGSTLTHGENFVWAPLGNEEEEILTEENSSLYRLAIMPVLEKKCFSCHNETKAKGKLIMTSIEKFKLGGKNGKEWIEGNPDSSRLVKYIHLPLEDDNHMPPDGKPQLSPIEISLLEAWIQSGADFEKKLNEFAEQDTLKFLAAAYIKSSGKKSEEKKYAFGPASMETIIKLNTPYRAVFPLFQNSPALQADFFARQSFQVNALEELKVINDQLTVLNLSKMPITDNELKIIGQFKNLEHLNLNFTSVIGEGLSNLSSLSHLQSISLSGTAVKGNALQPVLALPSLRQIFIWNTPISESEKAAMEKSFPKIEFVHKLFNDSGKLVLSKPILINESVMKKSELLELKHSMPGSIIRYTLDGSKPDSVSGLLYDKPVAINETVKIKVVACKEGWYCSKLLETVCYVEGHKPSQVMLLSPPDKKYPGEGAQTLTDGRKGFVDAFKDPAWLGFMNNAFEAGFDFGNQPPTLGKIMLSYGENLGSYIFPPTEVEVWAGSDSKNIKLIKTIKPDQPAAYRGQNLDVIVVPLEKANYPYYKIVAKPVSKLPQWHSGKGKPGWFFMDEVFFY